MGTQPFSLHFLPVPPPRPHPTVNSQLTLQNARLTIPLPKTAIPMNEQKKYFQADTITLYFRNMLGTFVHLERLDVSNKNLSTMHM